MYNNNMKGLIETANREGFAIPAFNYSDIWELLAIVEAARDRKAPVYIASNSLVVNTLGIDYCGALGKVAYKESHGYVLNHLDHAMEVDLCRKAIDSGYMSVMIDGSLKELMENIAMVKEVVRYAHDKGVIVEAEIGKIRGSNEEGTYTGNEYLGSVEEAVAMVSATNVDSLAVGIGNAHGFYKQPPHIHIDLLRDVHHAVSVPLVLHGSTGIPYETVRACIKMGLPR